MWFLCVVYIHVLKVFSPIQGGQGGRKFSLKDKSEYSLRNSSSQRQEI